MRDLVETLSRELEARQLMLATAESCTGGGLAAAITERPGSSKIFERGFVTYSNESKTELLGVPTSLIERHGAVSTECAAAMVKGALEHSRAQIAVSITGIAGPDGGSDSKPVGLVYIGYGDSKLTKTSQHVFSGDRAAIRLQAKEAALRHVIAFLKGPA